MSKQLLNAIREALAPTGVAAVTFVHAEGQDNGTRGVGFTPRRGDFREPELTRGKRSIAGCSKLDEGRSHSLVSPVTKPGGAGGCRQEGSLPPRGFRVQAHGITLAKRVSWDPGLRIMGLRAEGETIRSLAISK